MNTLDIINSVPDQPLIFLLAGIFLIIIAIFLTFDNKKLREAGIEADGIIYSMSGDKTTVAWGNADNSSWRNVNDAITVRFLTKEKVWITEQVKSDFKFSYTGQFKPGEAVKVIYNPENPKDFMLVTKQPVKIVRICIGVLGGLLVLVGAYQFLS